MLTAIARDSLAFKSCKSATPFQATVRVALVVQPGGGGGVVLDDVIETTWLVGVPSVAPPVGDERVRVQDVPPAAVPAASVIDAGFGVDEPSVNETEGELTVQPPVAPTDALTLPKVPLLRTTENVVEPVLAGMEVAVLARLRASCPGDWGVTLTVRLDIAPRVAVVVDRVTVQDVLAAADPAESVTVGGLATPELLAKLTVLALSRQPPETARLPLTAPVMPPERATENVVVPEPTGMPEAVPEALIDSVPASGATGLPEQRKTRLPLGSPTRLA